jgi:hypothetical protein
MGSYYCTCKSGWAGDGKNCSGMKKEQERDKNQKKKKKKKKEKKRN